MAAEFLLMGKRALMQAWNDARRTYKSPTVMMVVKFRCYSFGVVDALFPGLFRDAGPRGGKPPALQVHSFTRKDGLGLFYSVLGPTFDVSLPNRFNPHRYELDVDEKRPVRVIFRPGRMTLRVEFVKAHVYECNGRAYRESFTVESIRREIAVRRARALAVARARASCV